MKLRAWKQGKREDQELAVVGVMFSGEMERFGELGFRLEGVVDDVVIFLLDTGKLVEGSHGLDDGLIGDTPIEDFVIGFLRAALDTHFYDGTATGLEDFDLLFVDCGRVGVDFERPAYFGLVKFGEFFKFLFIADEEGVVGDSHGIDAGESVFDGFKFRDDVFDGAFSDPGTFSAVDFDPA